MGSTLNLYRLQQIDNQINQVQTRIQGNQQTLDDESAVQTAVENFQKSETRFTGAKDVLHQAEEELEALQIKIQQNESSLYGKSTHTPKELIDLQNEIASQKRLKTTYEDKILALMQDFETADIEKNQAHVEKDFIQSDRLGIEKQINNEMELLSNDLGRLHAERNAVIEGISSSEMDLYEKLRSEKRGIAVTIIDEKSCSACGSTLSAGQIQSARSPSSLFLCPSCGRILYGQ